MEKGQTVIIYEKPMTEEKPEGKAKLLEKINDLGDSELWTVRFVSDGFCCDRIIKKKINA